jgi:polyhydroxyalkanoate synthesis regulator phasin
MAKKDKKDRGRSDSVRAAVDQAFTAGAEQAETARGRAQDVFEELTQAAGRFREVIEEIRPPSGDDLKSIRESLDRLEQRVAALEAAKPAPRAPAKKAPARRKPAAAKKTTGTGS